MFKNLKDKLATQVNKTNQTLFSTILPTDSTSPRDPNNRTASSTSHDENLESNRSRIDSASSDVSQTQIGNTGYLPSPRQFVPPSDVESEYGGDESDHEASSKMQKLLNVYKNKFTQLKNAYAEVEREKDTLKNVLQQQQDTHIKRQTELRQKMKQELQMKEQTESIYLNEIKTRDKTIEEINHQLTERQDSLQTLERELQSLRDKNTQRETLLLRCKETIKTHQEKQETLVAERDHLQVQLQEKQAFIDSMAKDHSESNVSDPVHDTERLQEQLDSALLRVKQLEADLQTATEQQTEPDASGEIERQRDDLQRKYDELVVRFNGASSDQEQLVNEKLAVEMANEELREVARKDKQHLEELRTEIDILKKSLSTENEQHTRAYDTLKTDYENLTNELHQTKQARDDMQSLLDQTAQEQMKSESQQEPVQVTEYTADDTEEQSSTAITKLQRAYDESLATCVGLTEKLESQRQAHIEELAKLRNDHHMTVEQQLKDLREENERVQSQKEEEHQKATEVLKAKLEKIRGEQLSELKVTAKRVQDEAADLSSQINEQQKEITRLQQLLAEQTDALHQYEEESKGKASRIGQLEQAVESAKERDGQLASLQAELDEKKSHIDDIEKQLSAQREEIPRLNATIDSLKVTIEQHEHSQQSNETSRVNDQQLLEQKNDEIDALQRTLSSLKSEHQQTTDELRRQQSLISEKQAEIDDLQQQLTSHKSQLDGQLSTHQTELGKEKKRSDELQQEHTAKYAELETNFTRVLAEKTELENELDGMRIRIQISQTALNEKANDSSDALKRAEETIQELQDQSALQQAEIETLKSEIVSLMNINEENVRRNDEFDNEKFNLEQEIAEKDRQLSESNEKIEELESDLKQAQESGTKLRKALQKMKESMASKEQSNTQDAEIELQQTRTEYEQRLREQEREYDSKLKSMAKEMNRQIEERGQNYQQQLNDFIQKNHYMERDAISQSEQKLSNAEDRAFAAEQQMFGLQEQLKEKQLDHFRAMQDLQSQVQNLTKQIPQTAEDSTQTRIEEMNHSNGDAHAFLSEPTEVDYLKQIVLAYMTGTDRLTMAKVICAVLRYTEDEKSSILEHEKLRHSRWLNSTRQ